MNKFIFALKKENNLLWGCENYSKTKTMDYSENTFLSLIDKERNIYELAELYHQNRCPVETFMDILQDPKTGAEMKLVDNKLLGEKEYLIKDNVVYFKTDINISNDWKKQNTQFLNYHRSLSVYTMLNSTPIISYLAYKSGFGNVKNKRVLDIGGGTGHTLTSFFQYPETIDYYLLDPNLRLLHDQFIRIYPKLVFLKMKHLIAQGEYLPFKNNSFDLLLSISAIDHMEDYKKFILESYRVLSPGGKLLISSHLDVKAAKMDRTKSRSKIFSSSFWERVARYLYYRKHSVGNDDHTLHLENEMPIKNAMELAGFKIVGQEIFKRYFYLVGVKLQEAS